MYIRKISEENFINGKHNPTRSKELYNDNLIQIDI